MLKGCRRRTWERFGWSGWRSGWCCTSCTAYRHSQLRKDAVGRGLRPAVGAHRQSCLVPAHAARRTPAGWPSGRRGGESATAGPPSTRRSAHRRGMMWAASRTMKSAALPASRLPTSSNPSALAPPIVAARQQFAGARRRCPSASRSSTTSVATRKIDRSGPAPTSEPSAEARAGWPAASSSRRCRGRRSTWGSARSRTRARRRHSAAVSQMACANRLRGPDEAGLLVHVQVVLAEPAGARPRTPAAARRGGSGSAGRARGPARRIPRAVRGCTRARSAA